MRSRHIRIYAQRSGSEVITVLCAARKSVYKQLNVDVFDETRDAFTYHGSDPIIAHPPCRAWSAHMRHFSKPSPKEKQLAFHCLRLLIKNGGVLEHPKNSLFVRKIKHLKSIKIHTIHQSWWGYPTTKKTWLVTPVSWHLPEIPFALTQYGKEKQIFENMSKFQRHQTIEPFAKWLIKLVEING